MMTEKNNTTPQELVFTVYGTTAADLEAQAVKTAEAVFKPTYPIKIAYTYGEIEPVYSHSLRSGEQLYDLFKVNVRAKYCRCTITVDRMAATSITANKLYYYPTVEDQIAGLYKNNTTESNSSGNVYIYTGVGGPTTK